MTHLGGTPRAGLRRMVVVAVMVVPLALGLTGCSAVNKAVNAIKTVHNMLHGSAAINSLTSKIRRRRQRVLRGDLGHHGQRAGDDQLRG